MPDLISREAILEKSFTAPGYFSALVSSWDIAHAPAITPESLVRHGGGSSATQPLPTTSQGIETFLNFLREMTSRYVYWDARSERGGECRVADGYVVTPENDTYSFAWVLTHGNVYRRKPGEGNR